MNRHPATLSTGRLGAGLLASVILALAVGTHTGTTWRSVARAAPEDPVPRREAILGQLGGPVVAVAHLDDLAFVGVGPRVHALDVSDPANPTHVGQSDVMPGEIHDVVAAGGIVYVAHDKGLTLLDARDPVRLPMTDEWAMPGGAFDVALNDNYVYLSATGQAFALDVVLDVGDPWSVERVNWFGTQGPKTDVAIAGQLAYATRNVFLHVFDLADPAFPLEIPDIYGFYMDDYAYGVAADEEWVLVGRPADLTVLSAANPEGFPKPTPPLPTPIVSAMLLRPPHRGGRAPMSQPARSAARPALPVAVVDTAGPVRHIVLRDGLAYLAAGSTGGFRILDVADARNPATLAALPAGKAHHVELIGHHAYVSGGGDGLYVFDVSDPADPRAVRADPQPAPVEAVTAWTRALDVAWRGDTAFVAAGAGGLLALDVSDPSSPALIGRLSEPAPARRLDVDGSYVYMVSGSYTSQVPPGRLTIADVSDPVSPTVTGTVMTTGSAEAVDVAAGYAFVADGEAGVRIFDVSDAGAPREVGALDEGAWMAIDLLVDSGTAYVVDAEAGLRVLDVSDPTDPREIVATGPPAMSWGYHTQFATRGLDKVGSRLFVAGSTEPLERGFLQSEIPEDLLVIDVADPSSPQLELSIDLGDAHPRDVVVKDGWAYVASQGIVTRHGVKPSMLLAVNLAQPAERWAAYLPDGIWSVAVQGEVGLVAADLGGLVTLQVGGAVAPTATPGDVPPPWPTITRPPITRTATPTRKPWPTAAVPPTPTGPWRLTEKAYLPYAALRP